VRPQQLPQTENQNQQQQIQVTTFSAVLRRYSDFLWLYERLHHERAGAIVPPLPEKQPVGRFSPTFVEDRRVQLERFLRRVAVHPELADAACLDLFLRADDVTFHAAKSIKKGVGPVGGGGGGVYNNGGNINNMGNPYQPSSSNMMQPSASPKKDGFKRWFAEAKTSMTGDLVKSPDDDIFDEIHRYIHGLDNQMRNVSHQATGLVRKGKEIANGLFEFGLAFNLLGQSEADALGDALAKMGETADRLSVLSAEQAEKEMAQFEEPLQDYIKMINAVKLALQRRHEKRLTYSTCLSEVESKQTQLGKLRAQIGQEGKAYSLEMSLHRAREAAHVAQEDFATVSQRVLREVDRFKREKSEDMRRTVLDYINLQVEYNKRMEQVWAVLIPQLESVQLDTSGSSNAAVVVSSPPPLQQQQQQQPPMPNMMMGQQQQPPQYINTSLPPMPAAAPPMLPPVGSVPSPAMMAAGGAGVADPSMFAVQYSDS
jgi:sorting nexin-1/2